VTGRHGIADVLTLVGAIRRIAYDVTLEAGDALRRIRDAFADYDGMNKDHCDLTARHDGSQLRICGLALSSGGTVLPSWRHDVPDPV
jgi:hypothetical protein